MDSIEELKSSLKETLIKEGILNKIKAEMRQEIYNFIDKDNEPKPNLTKENFIINLLIKEYFDYNNYSFSSNVLVSETGQIKTDFNRDELTKELNIIESVNNKNKPLLYSILSGFMNHEENLIPLKIENNK